VALAFLTTFPVRFRNIPPAEAVARSRWWYPVVGLLLGATLGLWAAALTAWLRSVSLAAFLTLLAWVGLTGALHLDGFCDLCDGLFGGATPADRLRVMKDPHLGTFGLAGGVLLLLGKFVVLQEVLTNWPGRGPWLVAAAVAVGRCLALCLAAGARYPRPEGTGKALVEATRGWEAAPFAAAAVGVTFLAVPEDGAPAVLVLLAPALVVVAGLRWLCGRRLGGITGDCLGAAIELVEWIFLLAAALWQGLRSGPLSGG
jgi:adenosylcobinamide-GDP ribazoletransferase